LREVLDHLVGIRAGAFCAQHFRCVFGRHLALVALRQVSAGLSVHIRSRDLDANGLTDVLFAQVAAGIPARGGCARRATVIGGGPIDDFMHLLLYFNHNDLGWLGEGELWPMTGP
jgi:hypothetical protein